MSAIANQRAKTSHVLLTQLIPAALILKGQVPISLYIHVILEHVPKCTSVIGDSTHELPAFWSKNLWFCLGFLWCFLYGSFNLSKIKINPVVSPGYKITVHVYIYLKLQRIMEGKQKNGWLALLPLSTTALNPTSFKQLKPRSAMQHQYKLIFWLLSKGTRFTFRRNTNAVKPAAMPKDFVVFARQDWCVKKSYTMVKDISI